MPPHIPGKPCPNLEHSSRTGQLSQKREMNFLRPPPVEMMPSYSSH